MNTKTATYMILIIVGICVCGQQSYASDEPATYYTKLGVEPYALKAEIENACNTVNFSACSGCEPVKARGSAVCKTLLSDAARMQYDSGLEKKPVYWKEEGSVVSENYLIGTSIEYIKNDFSRNHFRSIGGVIPDKMKASVNMVLEGGDIMQDSVCDEYTMRESTNYVVLSTSLAERLRARGRKMFCPQLIEKLSKDYF